MKRFIVLNVLIGMAVTAESCPSDAVAIRQEPAPIVDGLTDVVEELFVSVSGTRCAHVLRGSLSGRQSYVALVTYLDADQKRIGREDYNYSKMPADHEVLSIVKRDLDGTGIWSASISTAPSLDDVRAGGTRLEYLATFLSHVPIKSDELKQRALDLGR